jgi:predicted N-acetyltransferase YhbS
MDVWIRKEEVPDFQEVYNLITDSFQQTDEAELVNRLRGSKAFIPELSLVAMAANKIAGHILFSKIIIKADTGEENESLAMAPVSVRPEYQRQGIGGNLIIRGLRIAGDMGYKSVIVLGHEHYYPKFGFLPAKKWRISAPFPVPPNVFMALELFPDGLTNVSGTVIYPPEFDL